MKKCGYCGRENEDAASSCRECGTEFEIAPTQQPNAANQDSAAPDLGVQSRVADGENIVASLNAAEAKSLVDLLQAEKINASIRSKLLEAGLESFDVIVEPADFDRACDVAERWQSALEEEWRKNSGKRCPNCGSWNFENAPHETLGQVLRCRDCQQEFL